MLSLQSTWEEELPSKKYEAGIANMNIDDEEDEVEAAAVEEAVGLIQCAFLQCHGSELNPNHIYLDTCTMFSQAL